MDEKKQQKEKAFSSIGTKSFLTVVALLLAILLFAGSLSYLIPQGSFQRDENDRIIDGTYEEYGIHGIEIWRVLTAPVRVFASEDALTVIMISIFLLIMSGVFNLLEKTNGIRVLIGKLIKKLSGRDSSVICIIVLVFMLFGSFFGMFEELVTLVPLIVMFSLSMGMDTMMGLGACMLAACFGFSAAITNPFSVGLASEIADVDTYNGMWLRVILFVIIYATLCTFLCIHRSRILRDPSLSLSYENDRIVKERLAERTEERIENEDKLFRVYAVFFGAQALILILIALFRAISAYAIPILAVSFLVGGIAAGLMVCEKKTNVLRYIGSGALAMLPAVVMIALASSVKLVLTESGVLDTVMCYVIRALDGKNKFVAILLIYLLILILQIFIGSSSAKIMLVMPIVMPICQTLGISPALVILAYCMADGFTDMILPTNPVLLVGLSMVNVSYTKWVKWTWKLQLLILVITVLMLLFAVGIGY